MKRYCLPTNSLVRRTLSLVTALAVLATAAVPAAAHRAASHRERAAAVAALTKQGELSKIQADCQAVTVSTIDHNWASATFPEHLSGECLEYAANGVIFEHYTRDGWRYVTDGSASTCPIRSMPTAVERDLDACHSLELSVAMGPGFEMRAGSGLSA